MNWTPTFEQVQTYQNYVRLRQELDGSACLDVNFLILMLSRVHILNFTSFDGLLGLQKVQF